MVGPAEMARRARSRVTHRLESLPILALSVHSACNCRCVMCDIWKANGDKREISSDDLERHVDAIRALHVQRVMLTGGEPLLHRNLWALCAKLQALGIRITLVTTGLLIDRHAADIAASIDTVVISLDGDRDVHDAIRRVKGGFDRIAAGVTALRGEHPAPRLIARSVVQRGNCASLHQTIAAAHRLGFDEISFLAADLSSSAFNRLEPWSAERIDEVAVGDDDLPRSKRRSSRRSRNRPQLIHDGLRRRRTRVARSDPAVLPGRGRTRRIPGGAVQRAVGIGRARAGRQRAPVFLSSRLRFRRGRSRRSVEFAGGDRLQAVAWRRSR